MGIGKYKYYFRKPRSEIAKDIILSILVAGALVGGGGASFATIFLRSSPLFKKYPRKKITDTFSRFRKEKLISFQKHNHQIFISLTEKGKAKAGMLQLNSLEIARPKQWDRKWRLLMFDIEEKTRIRREALRGKLKELGFAPFQKSIWIHPFNCMPEVGILKDFFGFTDKEVLVVVAQDIGDDTVFRKQFKLQ